jgi:tubulin polyglutamylase TTLL11
MNNLLRKGPLTLSLNVMRQLYNKQFDFYPRTWFLPEQLNDFSTDCRYIHEHQSKRNETLSTFIVKPNDGSQGSGIYLIKNPNEFIKKMSSNSNLNDETSDGILNITNEKSFIVQEYIHNPFLIDGLKSDLRLYVLILSLDPLEIYIGDEGLVRFATVNYESPDSSNISEIFMHLTNYSLNKKNESYRHTTTTNPIIINDETTSSGNGSKRKLTKVFKYMKSKGYNIDKIQKEIDDLVIKTIIALLPEMKVEYAFDTFNAPNKQRPNPFQVIII